MGERVRLRYSGLVAFGSHVYSVLTGLIFVIIVTRYLSVSDFGVWQYVGLIASYVIFPASMVPFWVTRFYARDYPVAKTGVVVNSLFSLPFLALFLLITPWASNIIKTPIIFFLMISAQVPLQYVIAGLNALAHGRKPHLIGYSLFMFESVKIIFAVLFFFILNMGLAGAIFAVVLAYTSMCVYLFLMLLGDIRGTINWNVAKKWFSSSWVPLFNDIAVFAYGLDLLILALIVQVPEPLAIYKVAYTVAAVILYSSSLAVGLYPRLLKGGGAGEVEEILKLCFMLAIPMLVGVTVLAEPILHLFNPEYEIATPLLWVMPSWMLLFSLITVLEVIIYGAEKVDLDVDVSFRKLMRSRLFILPIFKYIRSGVALPLVFVFTVLALSNFPAQALLYVAFAPLLANLVGDTFLCSVEYFMAKKAVKFRFPVKNIFKYTLAALIMGVVVFVLSPEKALYTVMTILVGAFVYFSVLLLIDAESRELLRRALSYLHYFRTSWV